MTTNRTYHKIKKALRLLSPDRRYIVYFLIVLTSSAFVLLFELIISHNFNKTTRIMLEQHNTRVGEYRRLADLEKDEIVQLKKLVETDTSLSVFFDQFLDYKKDARDSYEAATRLIQESKGVLESQLAFVKTEYEALEIWSALLTIVFLVFSFYSFYRMDQMREEGSKTLAMIRDDREKTQEKFSSSINDWTTKKEKWEEDIANAISKMSLEVQKKSDSLDTTMKLQKDYLDDEIFELNKKIDRELNTVKDNLSQRCSEWATGLDKITSTLSLFQSSLSEMERKTTALAELQLGVEKLKTSANNLSKLIPDIERRITSLEEDRMPSDFFELYYNQQRLEDRAKEDK